MDKTGTITQGMCRVIDDVYFNGGSNAILKPIAALEKKSNHPLAVAIINHGIGCVETVMVE